MKPIIALWSHPRSMSTATERIMRERGDCRCFHEPFIYHYYVERKVRVLPHFDIDPDQPAAYEAIKQVLLAAAEEETVFFKDMGYYVLQEVLADEAFARRLTHSFLIRDPKKAILSFYKLDPDLTDEEIGLEAQWHLLEGLEQDYGVASTVIEAEAVQQNPEGVMGAYWQAVGLPFAESAFDWNRRETPEGWDQVSGWHGTVQGSSGIKALRPEEAARREAAFDAAAEKEPKLREFLERHLPFYEKLKARAIRAAG